MAESGILEELGVSGLDSMGGLVYEELLPELRTQAQRSRVYKQMAEGDAVIGGILFAIDMLCRRVSWTFEPFDGNVPDDVDKATFATECMNDMTQGFEDMLSEIMTFIPQGWALLCETFKVREGAKAEDAKGVSTSKYNDGRIGWKSWSLRSQDTLYRWEFDEFGNAEAMVQQAPPTYEMHTIPLNRALLFRTTARKGNPEGRSAIRSAYRSWYYKQHIEQIEGIGIERDLAGLPIAWAPAAILSTTATAEQKALLDNMKRVVTGIRRDEQEGIVWPLQYDAQGHKLYDLTLLSTGGSRQFDTDKVINRYDTRMAMVVLADFILLGHQAVGSWALSSSKTNLFSYALGAFLDIVSDTINRHAIPRLFALNGWPLDRLPKLTHGDIETVDIAELGAFISAVTGAGVVLDERSTAWVLDQAGIPHNPIEAAAV